MSATISGALKAYLEQQGLGVQWFRDGAPPGQLPPFGVIQEAIAIASDSHGDMQDPDRDEGETELVQLDLWMQARGLTGAQAGRARSVEDYALPGKVRRLLRRFDGSYGTPPVRVYGLRVVSGQRWPISDNLIRHTITVSIRRGT